MIGWLRRHPRLTAFYALFALLCLAVTAPMGALFLFVSDPLVSARKAEESLFSGVLRDVGVGGARLGDLGAELDPLALLLARWNYRLFRPAQPASPGFEGGLRAAPGRVGLTGELATIRVDGAFGPLPLTAIELDGFSADFTASTCLTASGTVRARFGGGLGEQAGAALSGSARCEGARLLLPLVSASGAERLTLRIAADGAYDGELLLTAPPADVAAALSGLGFRATPVGQRLSVRGRL